MRRAAYSGGAGRLSVGDTWLLFIGDGQHPFAQELEEAAGSEQPGRSLVTALTHSGFDAPPFVFAQIEGKVQGIVFGNIQLQIHDGEVATVDGVATESWIHFDASSSSTLACGNSEFPGDLWIERGVVCAQGFCWQLRSQDHGATRHSVSLQSEPAEGETQPASFATPDPSPVNSDPKPESPKSETSLVDALNSEFDKTIDAIRFAEVRGAKDDKDPHSPQENQSASSVAPDETTSASHLGPASPEEEVGTASEAAASDVDATLDLGPGQVMLEAMHAERRMVDALVCIGCENPNPPSAIRCRHCDAPLSSATTELRKVPQPVLGVVHLSGNREELLDTDLLIGRNPGYQPLDRYQRAVVHAEGDRSVSRRHLELKLEHWKVMVVNLQEGARTILERHGGQRSKLAPGISQQLRSGDTVHYGSAWLRFEAEE